MHPSIVNPTSIAHVTSQKGSMIGLSMIRLSTRAMIWICSSLATAIGV